MVIAYVLVRTVPGKSWEVAEAVSKLESVQMAHSVAGPFDVIAFVKVPNLWSLKGLLGKIHAMDEVERTQTAISYKDG